MASGLGHFTIGIIDVVGWLRSEKSFIGQFWGLIFGDLRKLR
jgi:hypothetical protein